jgi:hypothetical protein
MGRSAAGASPFANTQASIKLVAVIRGADRSGGARNAKSGLSGLCSAYSTCACVQPSSPRGATLLQAHAQAQRSRRTASACVSPHEVEWSYNRRPGNKHKFTSCS